MKKILVLMMFIAAFSGKEVMSAQTPPLGEKSSQVVKIDDKHYYLHTVEQGQTVYSLAKLYAISEAQLYEENPVVGANGLKAGEVVKIVCVDVPEMELPRRKMQKTFSTHVVQLGETTYSISKHYSLSVTTLIQDNHGIDPTHLQAGQELNIRKSEMDKTSPQDIMVQMDNFASKLSIVSDDYHYHLVEIGETLYGISKKYNISVGDIEANNGLTEGMRAGLLLRIPLEGKRQKKSANKDLEIVVEQKVEQISHTVNFSKVGLGAIDIAVLLPLAENGVVKNNFVELYQGVLVAADELREEGRNVNINLYNTERSEDVVRNIIAMPGFRESDFIIGPVYEDGLKVVVDYAAEKEIPVVSPLANVDGRYGNNLFQLSPDPKCRYDKLNDMLGEGKNIVFITSDVTDVEFEREMKSVVDNRPYQKIVYRKGIPSEQINSLMSDSERDNVFIVVAGTESGVDLILAALSSVQNARLSRSKQTGSIKVIGNTKWNRYHNMDRNLFFKLNVSYITSYHADRGNRRVLNFDNKYISAFGQIPSLYSYRGYDAVKIFGSALAANNNDFMTELNNTPTPLETNYRFELQDGGIICNTGWALVTYGNDYTITVK